MNAGAAVIHLDEERQYYADLVVKLEKRVDSLIRERDDLKLTVGHYEAIFKNLKRVGRELADALGINLVVSPELLEKP